MLIKGSFKDLSEKKVELFIQTNNDSSEVLVINDEDSDILFSGNQPIYIEEGVDSTFTHLLKTTCSINLLTKSYVGNIFYSKDYRDSKVLVYKSGKCVFAGYISPLTFTQPYTAPYDEFTLNCIDYLTTLQDYQFGNITESTQFEAEKAKADKKTFQELLDMAFADFKKLDFMQKSTPHMYYDLSKGKDKNSLKTLFEDLQISEPYLLGKSVDRVWDYDQIMKAMLTYLNLHMCQMGTDLFIFDWNTIKDGRKTWYDLYSKTETEFTPSNVVYTKEISMGNDANININDVYSQIKLTDKIEDVDTLITNPLDSSTLYSPYDRKIKYMQEYMTEGDGDTSNKAINNMVKGKTTDYKAAHTYSWYLQTMLSKSWYFYYKDGKTIDELFSKDKSGKYYKEWNFPYYMRHHSCVPGIMRLGYVEKKTDRQDNSLVSNINTNDYFYISINGNENDSENGHEPTDNEIKSHSCIAEYIGANTGAIYTPNDEKTTNYIVFQGKITYQPITYESDSSKRAKKDGTYERCRLYGVKKTEQHGGKHNHETNTLHFDNLSNDDGAYYVRKFFTPDYASDNVTDKGSSSYLKDDASLQPYSDQREVYDYEYKYSSTDGDNADLITKIPVLCCEMTIGNKRCIEVQDTVKNEYGEYPTHFEWVEIGKEPTIDGYKRTWFTLGINPAIGDKLIGKEFPIQNTLSYEQGINLEGTAIPIKYTDGLSGKLTFRILGPWQLIWSNIKKVKHHSFWYWHSGKWQANDVYLLAHTENIIIKEFTAKIVTDNGGVSVDENNDLIYQSNIQNDGFTNKKDDIEFKFITQLTSQESFEKGIKNTININAVQNAKTSTCIRNLFNATTNTTAKPEEMYIDQYFTAFHTPKITAEIPVDDDYPWDFRNTYYSKYLQKSFFVQGYRWNLAERNLKLTIKEKGDVKINSQYVRGTAKQDFSSNLGDSTYQFTAPSFDVTYTGNNITNLSKSFNSIDSLTNITDFALTTDGTNNVDGLFKNCSNLRTVNLSNINLDNVDNLGNMFVGCDGLTTIYVTNCSSTTQNKILDQVKSKLPNYTWTLENGVIIRHFKTDGTDNTGKLMGTSNNPFETNINGTTYQFTSPSFNVDVDGQPTTLNGVFQNKTDLTNITLFGINSKNVTDISNLFNGCTHLESLNMSDVNLDNVTSKDNVFKGCESLTQVFVGGCSDKTKQTLIDALNASLSDYRWVLEDNVINRYTKQYIKGTSTAQTTGKGSLSNYTFPQGNFNVEYTGNTLTNLDNAFNGLTGITSLDLSDLDLSNLSSANGMLGNNDNLKSLDLSNSNFDNVDITDMFKGDNALTSVTVHNCSDVTKQKILSELQKDLPDYIWSLKDDVITRTNSTSQGGTQGGGSETGSTGGDTGSTGGGTDTGTTGGDTGSTGGGTDTGSTGGGTDEDYSGKIKGTTSATFQGNGALSNYTFTSPSFDISIKEKEITDLDDEFNGNDKIKTLDVFEVNTEKATSFENMFKDTSNLTKVNLNVDSSNVTNFGNMFRNSSKITVLDLSNMSTKSGTNYQNMFGGMSSLQTLIINKFKIDTSDNISDMFDGCSNLTKIYVMNTDTNSQNKILDQVKNDITAYTWSLSNGIISRGNSTSQGGDTGGTGSDTGTTGGDTGTTGGGSDTGNTGTTGTTTVGHIKGTTNSTFQGYSGTSLSAYTFTAPSFDVTYTGKTLTNLNQAFYCNSYITSISEWSVDTRNVTDMNSMFLWCGNLTSLDLSKFDTSNVTDMLQMFQGCKSITTLDVSNFDTSNVTDMNSMFQECSSLSSIDLSKFNTSNVTDMSFMFAWCSNLTSLDLSKFDTSKVTDMSYMFEICTDLKTLNLSNFDTRNVTNMSYMFYECNSLEEIKVTNCSSDTQNKILNQVKSDLPNYTWTLSNGIISRGNSTSQGGDTGGTGGGSDTGNTGTTTVNHIKGTATKAFQGGGSLSGYTFASPTFDVEYTGETLTDLTEAFSGKTDLTSITEWSVDTSHVNEMDRTFESTKLTSIDLSHFDTSNADSLAYMFNHCTELTSIDVSHFDTTNVETMTGMFNHCKKLTTLDVSNFNTSKVVGMVAMFQLCESITTLDLSNFDTSKVKSMEAMFNSCDNLKSLNLSSFNTSNVNRMFGMFGGCKSITTLDLSNFDTSKVTNMKYMFSGCDYLNSLDLSNFDVSGVQDMEYMFNGCLNLRTIKVLNCSSDTQNKLLEQVRADITAYTWTLKDGIISRGNSTSQGGDTGGTGSDTGTTGGNTGNTGTTTVNHIKGTATKAFQGSGDFSNYTFTAPSFDVEYTGETLTDLNSAFYAKLPLTSISEWMVDTSKVTNMDGIFYGCNNLRSLDLSHFDTSNATNMWGMFSNCPKLENLDISNFDASKVTNMDYMFDGCVSLKTIKVLNCSSATQQMILNQLQTDLSSYTWSLSNGIISRE